MASGYHFELILLLGIITYSSRAAVLLLLDHDKIPDTIIKTLELVPVAVFGALVVPAVLNIEHGVLFNFNAEFFAKLLCALALVIIWKLTKRPYVAFAAAATLFVTIAVVVL
jgi:branched-subunit amino acid transport protein